MTSSNGNIYALLALWVRNLPVTVQLPSQRPMARSFDVFVDLRLNKRLSKQSRPRWFEAPSCSLWRHYNVKHLVSKAIGMILTLLQFSLWFTFTNIIYLYHRDLLHRCSENQAIVSMSLKRFWRIWMNNLHRFTSNNNLAEINPNTD